MSKEAMKLALNEMRRLARLANVDHTENQGIVALEQVIALAEQSAHQQPAWRTQGGIPRFKPQPAQQEPVLWQILNGVCHQGVRSTEQLAQQAAADMQKTHDLGGSLAAFHVRPLYTRPQARDCKECPCNKQN